MFVLTVEEKLNYTKEFLDAPTEETLEDSTAGYVEYNSYLARSASGKEGTSYDVSYYYTKRNLCISFVILVIPGEPIVTTSVVVNTIGVKDEMDFTKLSNKVYSEEELTALNAKIKEIATVLVEAFSE